MPPSAQAATEEVSRNGPADVIPITVVSSEPLTTESGGPILLVGWADAYARCEARVALEVPCAGQGIGVDMDDVDLSIHHFTCLE